MKGAVEMLQKEKEDTDKIIAPEIMETRLNNALKSKKFRRTGIGSNWKLKVAAAVVTLVFMLYNIDTFAYYGKKLTGYDRIMNTTLSHLNELGKGQSIEKSYTLKNGVVVTLDGIMLDDNQLLAFVTVKSPDKNISSMDLNFEPWVKGSFGNYLMNSSTGEIYEDKGEIKYICTIEPPHFYDSEMKIGFSINKGGLKEAGEIEFKLDRNKAMGSVLKEKVNQSFKVDDTQIRINSISASPVNTVIRGTVQNNFELAEDQISGERIRPGSIDLRLIADGKELPGQGCGMGTDMRGITFDSSYDALPDGVKDLKLKLVSFSADHDVKASMDLKLDDTNKKLSILGQEITINRVYESKGDTYVNFTSDESVVLTRVKLLMDDNRVSLEDTIPGEHEKTMDGKILYTRTMHFKGTGAKLQLIVERITYSRECSQIINISVK